MTVFVEAEPARAEPFLTPDPDASPLDPALATFAGTLRDAYRARVQTYERALTTELGARSPASGELPASAYPSLPVVLDDEVELIAFDADLFQTLFDLYTTDGWTAVAAVEAALARRARPETEPQNPSGGTPDLTWYTAWTFFVFTRNVLALLIRDALMECERLAAERIVTRLSVTAASVAQTWNRLQVVRTETVLPASGDSPLDDSQTLVQYHYGDEAMMRALEQAVRAAVDQRSAWEQLADRLVDYRASLERARAREQSRGSQGRSPYPEDLDAAERERLERIVHRESGLLAATEGWYKAMSEVIHLNVPLALLVVDGLPSGFTRPQFRTVFGDALWSLYARIDDLGRAIDPESSRVAGIVPGIALGRPAIILEEVQRLVVDPRGPERAFAAYATDRLAVDPGLFPLLHAQTLRLLAAQDIPRDSFGYVVMHHHLIAVDDELDAIRREDDMGKAFFSVFARVAAALSIALLVTPAAEVSPALRGLAAAADLAYLAYSLHSAAGQLALLDETLQSRLVDPDAFGMDALAQIGALMLARREFAERMSDQLLAEFLLLLAGGRFETVRRLLIARGFYFDLESLFAGDES